jgi:Uncharacterized protein conserved in bacteria (DUF2252)
MRIVRATKLYEAWLAEQTEIVPADLELKHEKMSSGAFPFLRATYYRWAQVWPKVCANLQTAPVVLAVADLHIENFGTWRDAEGRLIWGVNDFDEVTPLPYTNDLLRLATSAALAIQAGHLALPPSAAYDALLGGYLDGLQAGGKPFVLAAEHGWLREATRGLRDPKAFWTKLNSLPTTTEPLSAGAVAALELLLPTPHPFYRVVHRVAGMGSLGRQRWVALAEWQGGTIAREAKALLPSAERWASKALTSRKILYQTLLTGSVRAGDPLVRQKGHWIIRRLAPDCVRVELASLAANRDEERLLRAMGWETANVHLGTPDASAGLIRDVQARPAGWLHEAATAMVKAVSADFEEWRAQETEPTTSLRT